VRKPQARDDCHLLGFTSHILVAPPVFLPTCGGHIPNPLKTNISHLYPSPSLSSTGYLEIKGGSHRITRSRWPSPGNSTVRPCSTGPVSYRERRNRNIKAGVYLPSLRVQRRLRIPVADHALWALCPCRCFRQIPLETPTMLGKGIMGRTSIPGLPKQAGDQSLDRLAEQQRWGAKAQPP
jgi:hypothetical protein